MAFGLRNRLWGAILAQLTAAATATIKRRAIVFGLWVASGLLMLFAGGYALDALHTFLAFRWGLVAASLAIAAGLLLSAFTAALAGYLVSGKRSKPIVVRLQDSSEIAAATKHLAGSKRAVAPAAAGAIAGAVAVATLALLRRVPRQTRAPKRLNKASRLG